MAEKPKKNQYPAYALKSDDGEIEERWNQDQIINNTLIKGNPLWKANLKNPEETGYRAWLVKKFDFHINPHTTGFCGSFFMRYLFRNG